MCLELYAPNLKNILRGKWHLSGLERPSGSTTMYENTFGARLIQVPSLLNYQCTNTVYNFG